VTRGEGVRAGGTGRGGGRGAIQAREEIVRSRVHECAQGLQRDRVRVGSGEATVAGPVIQLGGVCGVDVGPARDAALGVSEFYGDRDQFRPFRIQLGSRCLDRFEINRIMQTGVFVGSGANGETIAPGRCSASPPVVASAP